MLPRSLNRATGRTVASLLEKRTLGAGVQVLGNQDVQFVTHLL